MAMNMFQHTAARRRLRETLNAIPLHLLVSTHSRPKATVTHSFGDVHIYSFNTQPPEGDCKLWRPN